MPRPSRRTRSKKRRQLKSSGGRTITRYGKEKTNLPHCSNCGQVLAGLPRPELSSINKLPEIREELDVCIAVIYVTVASVILSERQQGIFETQGRLSDREKPWGRTEEKNRNMY